MPKYCVVSYNTEQSASVLAILDSDAANSLLEFYLREEYTHSH